MMPFFRTPYTDEILYSVLARYHVWAGNTRPKATMQEVFGSKTATVIVYLPCGGDIYSRAGIMASNIEQN